MTRSDLQSWQADCFRRQRFLSTRSLSPCQRENAQVEPKLLCSSGLATGKLPKSPAAARLPHLPHLQSCINSMARVWSVPPVKKQIPFGFGNFKSFIAVLVFQVVARGAAPADAVKWSWQEPQAKVLPTGDLEWAPRPFEFKAGESVRYIDFDVRQRRQRRPLETDALEASSLGPQRHRPGEGLQGRAHLRLQAGRRLSRRAERERVGHAGDAHRPDPRPVLGRGAGGHLRFGSGDRLEAGGRQHRSSRSRRRSGTWTSTGRRETSGWWARTAP